LKNGGGWLKVWHKRAKNAKEVQKERIILPKRCVFVCKAVYLGIEGFWAPLFLS